MTRSIATGRLRAADCRLEDLVDVLAERTDPADYPHAAEVVDEVLVYGRTGCARPWPTGPPTSSPPSWSGRCRPAPGSWCSAGRSRTARCSTGPPRRSRS